MKALRKFLLPTLPSPAKVQTIQLNLEDLKFLTYLKQSLIWKFQHDMGQVLACENLGESTTSIHLPLAFFTLISITKAVVLGQLRRAQNFLIMKSFLGTLHFISLNMTNKFFPFTQRQRLVAGGIFHESKQKCKQIIKSVQHGL